MTEKRRIYLNEFNVLMENTAYLPLVSGLLRAYAETFEDITANYEFMPFIFIRDDVENIISRYDRPSVAAFSVYMWNEQLCLYVSKRLKELYPECLIIFGGPQVPHNPKLYFEQNPQIDVAVRGEGESTFAEILKRNINSRNFEGINGIAWRDIRTGMVIRNDAEQILPADLDIYPSPYLSRLFDPLIKENKDLQFQAIIETNRGCPFSCAYCFWGQGGLNRKMRYHSLERIAGEIRWLAEHKIKYVFNADSNFGINKRDIEIARMLVESKKQYGYPEKFRSCFTKNAEDRIYDIAMLLCKNDMEKGITLSFQSLNKDVLRNIKRQNIKLSTYENLQAKFNRDNIPVYTELILGLPGETYRSWVDGVNTLFESGFRGQLFVYLCEIYPNTDLADTEYQKRFGIVSKRIMLTETHGAIRGVGLISEYQDIIISTESMSLNDWRRSLIFSWMTMALFSLKLCFFILLYLRRRYDVRFSDFIEYICNLDVYSNKTSVLKDELNEFNKHIDRIIDGQGRSCELREFGTIYWDMEEASFLRINKRLDQFYQEMQSIIETFLSHRDIEFNHDELSEVIKYQHLRIPTFQDIGTKEHLFVFNLPEYFENLMKSDRAVLLKKPQIMKVRYNEFNGDKVRFAREVVLWGRKSNRIIVPCEWKNVTN